MWKGNHSSTCFKEDLVAERIAIDSYRAMINYFGNDDPTTRRLMQTILAIEEKHADDLASLLGELGAQSGLHCSISLDYGTMVPT